MAKYSDDFKLKLVKEYIDGPLGYILLSKKYVIPGPKPIKKVDIRCNFLHDRYTDRFTKRYRRLI